MEADLKGLFSLCMIVKNEEGVLSRCLDSVTGLMDEIIIVDTGSTDGTVSVAERYTEKVFLYPWNEDFADARNYSFAQATMPYVIWMDADELLAAPEAEKAARLKLQLAQEREGVDVVWMGTRLFDDKEKAASASLPVFTARRPRIVRRERNFRWHGRVHEDLDISGAAELDTDIYIEHRPVAAHTSRNRKILERWMAEESNGEGRVLFHYANECFDDREYSAAAVSYEQLLSEPSGYREDRITACLRLAECYRQLGEPEKRLNSLLRSFRYGLPQSDVCCSVAGFFEECQEWESAVYWYLQAISRQSAGAGNRPVMQICYTWLPHVLLTRCYTAIREWRQAWMHNERALAYLPGDQVLLGIRSKLQAALDSRGDL